MKKLNDDVIQVIVDCISKMESTEREIAQLYKGYEDKIISYISNLFAKVGKEGQLKSSDMMKYNRLQSFQKYLEEQAITIIEKETNNINTLLALLFSDVYYRQAFVLGKHTQTNVKFKKLAKEDIEKVVKENWNGTVFAERIKNNHIALISKIITYFANSLRQQQTLDSIAKEVNKTMNIRFSHSKSLVETEAFRVIADSQIESFNDSRIVEKLYFHATLDEKTTHYCRDHHGLVYLMDDPLRPMLPAHIHCRSIWLPIIMEVTQSKSYRDRDFDSFEEWYNFNI